MSLYGGVVFASFFVGLGIWMTGVALYFCVQGFLNSIEQPLPHPNQDFDGSVSSIKMAHVGGLLGILLVVFLLLPQHSQMVPQDNSNGTPINRQGPQSAEASGQPSLQRLLAKINAPIIAKLKGLGSCPAIEP